MQRPDDSTSDGRVPTTPRASSRKICRHCGAAVKTDEWYPVSPRTAADGSVEIHAFCDEGWERWSDGSD